MIAGSYGLISLLISAGVINNVYLTVLMTIGINIILAISLNLIIGVTSGFEKKLEIVGTGYRVTPKGNDLEFALGYSHPINIHRSRGYYLRSGGC